MRFTVATYGSEGDTRPFVALCRGLIASGHRVRLFAEQSSIHNAHTHGVPVEPLGGDIKGTLPLDNPMRELRTADVLAATKAGLRVVNHNAAAWMKAVAEDARGADAILFAGLASLASRTVAEELDKPAIALWLQPTTPTREFASPTLPPMKLPGWQSENCRPISIGLCGVLLKQDRRPRRSTGACTRRRFHKMEFQISILWNSWV